MTFEEIKKLMKQFDDSSLSELRYEQDGASLTLKKADESHPVYTQPMMVHPHAMPVAGTTPMAMPVGDPAATGVTGQTADPGTVPAGAPQSGAESDATQLAPGVEVITSPIVGTFYRSPSPDSPPFCQEESVVEKGKPICIIEAMKVMNELEAEFTMEIVAFKLNNGDMVEYGTPIVEVRRV
ncbi:MAG: acetyl-CoA carboxylase, biotin carboxyl carrier protein [Spirochaeta sp.]|jgi:acetyl-CoA carboxylase biotin carboxyl carrier protein|nr:acetyl-CoA carboxylase, biotin carboxyl carrier protein [Spirochaeta sp.]